MREKVEAIREGIAGAGLEALLPGFFEGGLDTVFDYLAAHGQPPLLYLDDGSGLKSALDELSAEVARSHQDSVDRGELVYGPEAHFLSGEDVVGKLLAMERVEAGALPLATDTERRAAGALRLRQHHRPARGDSLAPRRGGRAHAAAREARPLARRAARPR